MSGIRKATRKRVKLKAGISGPSGTGKTFSALRLARGLASDWSKVCVIDSEGSADKYAGHPTLGDYSVNPLYEKVGADRFAPNAWIGAIKECVDAGMEVAIIDSGTHEWKWCLGYLQKIGGRFQEWSKVSPEHENFIRAIQLCPIHLLICLRSKTEYIITNESGRKPTVEKVGLRPETREGFEYELDLMLSLDTKHLARVEKDRTEIFAGRADFMLTEAHGQELISWTEGKVASGRRE